MRSDVSTIKFDGNDTITMPLSVYLEIQAALRHHGDTDLPRFEKVVEEVVVGGFAILSTDELPTSGSVWPGKKF